MIFYTLKGPGQTMEILEDRIKLRKKSLLWLFTRSPRENYWELAALAHFEITSPQYLIWGKLEWKTFDGKKGSFRFSTNQEMVKKIEKYLQKKIIKNHQKVLPLSAKKEGELISPKIKLAG